MFANLEGGRGEHSVACNACCNCVDVDRTMKMAENGRGRRITLKKGCLLYYYYSSSFFFSTSSGKFSLATVFLGFFGVALLSLELIRSISFL